MPGKVTDVLFHPFERKKKLFDLSLTILFIYFIFLHFAEQLSQDKFSLVTGHPRYNANAGDPKYTTAIMQTALYAFHFHLLETMTTDSEKCSRNIYVVRV